jgi:hypothetical protein
MRRGRKVGDRVEELFYIADRATVDCAADLIDRFGIDAGFEAATRADHYRDLGNAINFCRWRQIERVILLLSAEEAVGTIQ